MTPGTEELPTEMGALAEKLTEAQRKAVMDGLARYMDPNTVRALRRKGLVEGRSTMLTMSGLALRAHLQANSPNSDSKDAGR